MVSCLKIPAQIIDKGLPKHPPYPLNWSLFHFRADRQVTLSLSGGSTGICLIFFKELKPSPRKVSRAEEEIAQ
jgi:hypothetical protein